MTRRRLSQGGGFTLIEVLLALSLLAIGLLSLAGMQLIALDHSSRGRHQTQASTVAELQMEQLMRRRWTNLAPTAWTAPTLVTNLVQTGAGDVNEKTYSVSWRITDVDAGRTRSVDVRVQWNDKDRPNRTYALSSIRFNHEGL